MQAAHTTVYGAPPVLTIREVSTPSAAEGEVLVQVKASPVTVGDQRLRSADFPGISALPGRLMLGVFRPRRAVQGTMFAGRVVAVGSGVTRFSVGDDVFGSAEHGAYAEYLCVAQDGPIARLPAGFNYAQAAAVPYGAVTALRFLRDLGNVAPGQRVLIAGASGGVGRFAIQLAKHLGAEVTAVCSGQHADLVRELGADHVVDYELSDFTQSEQRYDVIFDVVGAASFGRARRVLTHNGRYLTLMLSVGVLLQMALTALRGGQRAQFGIALGTREDLEELRELMQQGVLRPVLGRSFPLQRIVEAHAAAEAVRSGCVLVMPWPA